MFEGKNYEKAVQPDEALPLPQITKFYAEATGSTVDCKHATINKIREVCLSSTIVNQS